MARRGNPQTNLSVNYDGDGILGTKNSVVLINTSENNEKSLLKGEKGKTRIAQSLVAYCFFLEKEFGLSVVVYKKEV